MLQADHLRAQSLQTLVENRTTYTLEALELHLFETHRAAERVELQFDQPVLASMLRGKKIMHLRNDPGFAFLPGESMLLPAGETMHIDFPEATSRAPTKCLALAIDKREVEQALQLMNEQRPRADGREWSARHDNLHFTNQPAINQLLQRMVYLCAEDHPAKDLFVGMHLRELLIRVLQTDARQRHLATAEERATDSPLGAVIAYVRKHLDAKLTVAELSRVACMSESAFYRAFRNEMDCSPIEFVTAERLRVAANLLRARECSIREVALSCGFNSVSYFTRVFGEHFGQSPGNFQEGHRGVNFPSIAGR